MDVGGLGVRLREQRRRRGLSLDELAGLSEISRSMISAVERGTKLPTVLVLARLATALGVTVSRLLGEEQPDRVITLRAREQPAIRDETGWQRRILSPNLPGVEFEFIRTTVPPGVLVGAFAAHAPGSREYLAVETGRLTVTLDGVTHEVDTGDALYYAGDCVHAFANPGDVECVYYTAMHVPVHDHHVALEDL
ncbi:XRE family transcriptional regulator [Spongiactinospora sp. TRM90649]|uniref:helix-turn-helix domain-containing protein n=1 Tax=Spongiactinospora sp. TRM90649 TaxID=3031114 RepID=UPI0023F9E833|nr:XRE family transcriptional regulator [Spongiactinospora sp. TRM90649]MDF5753292.1 XRE family transcriptional regulator [Spongiactinospora sp. TRM90649]